MRPARSFFGTAPRLAVGLGLALVLSTGLAACSRRAASPAPDAGPRTEPIAPGSPLHTDQLDLAKIQLDLAQCRAAIRAYQQTNDGRSPATLTELGVQLAFPNDVTYDARSGTVRSKTYPAY